MAGQDAEVKSFPACKGDIVILGARLSSSAQARTCAGRVAEHLRAKAQMEFLTICISGRPVLLLFELVRLFLRRL